MKHPTIMEEVAGHNVSKLGSGEGKTAQITNLPLVWKARGDQTGFQFSVYELTLEPDVGISLHKHPYPEFFYVLDGQVDFACLGEDGHVEWLHCSAGDSVMAPPNAPHTFHNRSDKPGKFLSVSNYQHQAMLDTAEEKVNRSQGFSTRMSPEVFRELNDAFEQHQSYIVEV